jgi:hypothetical protein
MALKPTPARPREPARLPNRCPEGESLERIAAALETGNDMNARSLAALESISASLDRIAPLAEGMAELNERLTKLCIFIRNHRLKILAAIAALASTPGLIAPELLAALKAATAAAMGAG